MAMVSFRIEDELKEEIDRLTAERGLNTSEIFRQALADKIEELHSPPNQHAGIRLSLIERQLFVQQLKILAELKPKERTYYTKHINALEQGYEFHYGEVFDNLSETMSPRECREILDILDMFSDLRFSYSLLDDKSEIDAEEIEFAGFDGNHELKQMQYAEYCTLERDRFNSLHSRIKKHGVNSHWPMLEEYRRMLPIWRKRKTLGRPPLKKADVKAIIEAR